MKFENIPTSDFDLQNMITELKIKNYVGAFLKDQLPRTLKKNHHLIANLDSSNSYGGTHWVSLSNIAKDGYLSYFDSFGLPPPEEIVKLAKRMKKRLMYNTTQYQKLNTNYCGQFCVYFIRERENGKSFYDSLYQIDNTTNNFIKKYFEKL